MSGIVGILNLDGTPIEERLLRHMTRFMTFRGPDAQEVWTDGNVGFGHAMLRTTFEAEREQQPCSLDGQVWITADARVDGRADLIRELKTRGRDVSERATDVELILHAYHTWEVECVQHLIGDFAFAIWDGRQRRLFCARDHFGVKPLYFAHVGNHLIVSNTLNVIRLHPAVSAELNDLAIADFLLFGYNQEPETTTFTDIQRVPAAHTLIWSEGNKAALRSRYWTLPTDGCIRYKKTQDYVEHFKHLFWQAVGDRLRLDKIGVFMSGGLDSTSIAVAAKDLIDKRGGHSHLRAHTAVYDHLIPDQERHYAGLVAEKLGISIHFLSADRYTPFERHETGLYGTPEPLNNSLAALSKDLYRQAVLSARVVLSGHGGDQFMRIRSFYFMRMLWELKFIRFGTEIVRYIQDVGRRPSLGPKGVLLRLRQHREYDTPFPDFMNEDLVTQLCLKERWVAGGWKPEHIHPLRPLAYKLAASLYCSIYFEQNDPGTLGEAIEVRHPYFDIRVAQYLLALPDSHLLVDKGILRMVMKGLLPDEVRLRGKVALGTIGNPSLVRLQRGDTRVPEIVSRAAHLSRYAISLDPSRFWEENCSQYWALNFWLRAQN